jgi:hypothetical protein
MILIAIYNTDTIPSLSANQFFSTWGGFYTSVLLLTMWFAASTTTTDWILLCTSSTAVLGSLLVIRGRPGDGSESSTNDKNCLVDGNYTCEIMVGAIVIAAISSVVGFGMACIALIPTSKQNLRIPHITVATLMLLAWCGETFLIVYGGGPGQNMGGTFFSTWLSFFLCLDLATAHYCVYLKARQGLKQPEGALTDEQKENHDTVVVEHDAETAQPNDGSNVLVDLVMNEGSNCGLPSEMIDDPDVVEDPTMQQQGLDGGGS